MKSPPEPTVEGPESRPDGSLIEAVVDASRSLAATCRRRTALVTAIVLCGIVLMGEAGIQIHRIEGLMPYPQHIDEHHLTSQALKIIQTGNFNTRFFDWPALPFHMTTGAMILGYIRAARNGELKSTSEIGSVGHPYYTRDTVMWPVRVMPVLLLVAAAAFMGVAAYRFMAEPALLYLVPFSVLCSELIFVYLPSYLNPDTFGVFFIALLYLYLSRWGRVDSMLAQAVWPGVLCGLVISCKYPLVWVLLAPSTAIVCWATRQRLARIMVMTACCAAVFLLVNPSIVVGFSHFLDDIGFEVHHYATGHPGRVGTPGSSQLAFHLLMILEDFGGLTIVWFALGAVGLFRRSWKNALVMLIYPAAQLMHFSTFVVNFRRNIAFVYVVYGTVIAIGLVMGYRLLVAAIARYSRDSTLAVRRWSAAAVVAFLALFTFRVERPLELMRAAPDSRHQVVEWLQKNAGSSTVVIPDELAIDTRELEKTVSVRRIRLADLPEDGLRLPQDSSLAEAYLLMPTFDVSGKARGDLEAVATAKRLNRFGEALDVVQRFGSRKVIVNWNFGTEGSPAIGIARIRDPGVASDHGGDP